MQNLLRLTSLSLQLYIHCDVVICDSRIRLSDACKKRRCYSPDNRMKGGAIIFIFMHLKKKKKCFNFNICSSSKESCFKCPRRHIGVFWMHPSKMIIKVTFKHDIAVVALFYIKHFEINFVFLPPPP